ncbi:Glutamate-gated kainate-type ion channel receptor subunit GluR5 [Handroanthus impetiginosus]|uniref:Glutamate receptor n=1 Tax=Handroanthus impetiginosus TaxID=429701 RepID=A0A2G9HCM7_9LAMI|nr:Glutamate-gated kainate-type ion channel receptor subunit GluR5 [Handroanthus impetiginosus]
MDWFFPNLYVLLLSLLVVLLCNARVQVPNYTSFQVGVILDLDSLVGSVGLSSLSLALSDFYSANTNYSTRLVLHVRDSRGQVIDAATAALSLLNEVEVDAIIGPQTTSEASFVIDLGDKANVPIISFSATSPFHPRTPYFVQSVLSDSAQVDAIAAIVNYFQWNQVVLVGEDSGFGNGIIPYLSNALRQVDVRVSYRSIVPLSATDDVLLRELYKMKTMETRIFVVHVSTSIGSRLFPLVKEAGMMVEGYAWIVTSSLMDLVYSLDPHVIETMQGVLGVKPLIPRSRKLSSTATRWKRKFLHDNPTSSQVEFSLYGAWAYDTLWALAMAAERVGFREPSPLQNNTILNYTNLFSTKLSQTGPKLLEAISGVTFQGLGGKFHIVNGQLEASSFQILNVVGNGEREVGIWTPKGILSDISVNFTSLSDKKLKSIIFPGDSMVVPKGWEVPVSGKKLRIGVPVRPSYTDFVRVEKDHRTNASKVTGLYIDMFEAVMASLPYAVPYEYVPFEKPDGSSAGTYDELSHQVFLQNYDGAVGDITVTFKRAKYVDFTIPFAEGGVSMVVPIRYDDTNNEWVFLKPLKKELWLTAIALFILTGMALWILEHRLNNAYRGPPSQHAGMIFYFPFMSIVFAQRERIVSNLARLVVVVWMFVVLILSSTYTASLSARLTVQRLQLSVTDVKELIRRGDYVGCHNGSFIIDLLQGLGFDKLNIRTYYNHDDCAEALSKGSEKGGISALFAAKPVTKLFLSKYCDKFTTAGPTYATEGYAFVFPKGSLLVADVSRAILELTDNGKKLEIERQWMRNPACNGPDGMITSTSVSLQSFKTLFGITGGITATSLVVFIVTYMYKNRDFVQTISKSNATFWSKVCAICKHFDERDTKNFQSKGGKEDGEDGLANVCVNPQLTRTVVPISSEEIDYVNSSLGPQSTSTVVPISSEEIGDHVNSSLGPQSTSTVVPISSEEIGDQVNSSLGPTSEETSDNC